MVARRRYCRHASVCVRDLTAALDAEQAPVRAAAGLALGRIGSDPAVLKSRLEDSSMEVRMSAVLALGAHSSPAARHVLLGLATAPGAQLAPLAVVALVSGADAASGDADALASSRVLGDYSSALAATSGGRVDAPALRERCRKLITGSGDAVLRARAAEVLATGADHATMALLTDALSGPSVDVRRSAALALGRSRHPLALPALMTAFELEHELLARAFLLLAIGDHGGAEAGAFLSEQVSEGRKPLRAWAALGLGLWGRERDDAAARKAVRDGYQSEGNRQQDGAWLLALGMLRDRDSLPMFSAALGGRDSRTRAAAADALALCGDKTAPEILRTTLRSDQCPFVRGAAASALGICGGRIDVEALAEAARTDAVPEVRGAAATALGALGSEPALAALLALATATDATTRAGAMRGLGRIARTKRYRRPQCGRGRPTSPCSRSGSAGRSARSSRSVWHRLASGVEIRHREQVVAGEDRHEDARVVGTFERVEAGPVVRQMSAVEHLHGNRRSHGVVGERRELAHRAPAGHRGPGPGAGQPASRWWFDSPGASVP